MFLVSLVPGEKHAKPFPKSLCGTVRSHAMTPMLRNLARPARPGFASTGKGTSAQQGAASHRLLSILLLCSLLIGLLLPSACATRLAYSQMDRIVVWKLRDYISLEASTKARVQELLAERLFWHCRTELPEYVRLLNDIHEALAQRAPRGSALAVPALATHELRGFAREIETRWMELMRVLATDVSEVLAYATENERRSLYLKLAKQHQKNWETYVHPTRTERIANRTERMEKRARQWLGRLNAEQQTAIIAWSEALADQPELWLAFRSQWNSLLQAVVEQNLGDPTNLRTDLETLFANPSTLWTQEYREVVEFNTDRTIRLLEQLIDAASSNQLDRAQQRLTSLVRDLERAQCMPRPNRSTSQD
jgi:hypothetical protein